MTYSFDQIIERKKTNSTKWLKFSDPEVIPMWIADMDFTCPDEITEAMHERINQGVFGYTDSYLNLTEVFIQRVKEKELSGINITLPFKQKVIKFTNQLINDAKLTNSVNTIFLDLSLIHI